MGGDQGQGGQLDGDVAEAADLHHARDNILKQKTFL